MSNGSRIKIRIDDTGIPVRDFASYLKFVDRSYGRLTSGSLHSYAQKRKEHISISRVRPGSFEIVIEEAIKHSPALIALYLVLKYLPTAIKDSFEAYQSFQEGQLAKVQAAEIRHRLEAEPALSSFDSNEKMKFAQEVSEIYSKEQPHLTPTIRFSEEHVISVDIEDR